MSDCLCGRIGKQYKVVGFDLMKLELMNLKLPDRTNELSQDQILFLDKLIT